LQTSPAEKIPGGTGKCQVNYFSWNWLTIFTDSDGEGLMGTGILFPHFNEVEVEEKKKVKVKVEVEGKKRKEVEIEIVVEEKNSLTLTSTLT
jgi:hypothetical protein